MGITTISSREFNQDISRAKKASADGPVFITDRGKLAHILLNVDEYRRITGVKRNIVEALSMPGLEDIDIEFPRSREVSKPFDFD